MREKRKEPTGKKEGKNKMVKNATSVHAGTSEKWKRRCGRERGKMEKRKEGSKVEKGRERKWKQTNKQTQQRLLKLLGTGFGAKSKGNAEMGWPCPVLQGLRMNVGWGFHQVFLESKPQAAGKIRGRRARIWGEGRMEKNGLCPCPIPSVDSHTKKPR